RELSHPVLPLLILRPEAVNLCPRGVPHRVCLQPRLASFHEVLEPRIVDVRADALSAAQLTHRRLAPEPLQHDSHLLFGSELPSRRPAYLTRELWSFVGSRLSLRRVCCNLP